MPQDQWGELLRCKREKPEQRILQLHASGKVFPDPPFDFRISCAVSFENVCKTVFQADYLLVPDTLVGVVDDFAGREYSLLTAYVIMVPQQDMFLDDAGDLGITKTHTDPPHPARA